MASTSSRTLWKLPSRMTSSVKSAKEALHEVHPRARGWGEVEHHSITLHGSALGGVAPFQPGLHLRVLVGAVVVHDQMQRHVVRHLAVDGLQERQPLAMSMLGRRQAEDLAIEVAEGREESDGPMAVVVVGSGADVADAERQPRLRSLESLALALLVAAKDQGSIRWIEVEADDVPELRLELGVLGDLERPCNVRLDVVAGPDPLDRSLGDPHSIGHGAHRPPPRAIVRSCGSAAELTMPRGA